MAIVNTVLYSTGNVAHTSAGDTVISSAYFCNNDSVPRSVWVYLVPSGDTLDANVHTVYKDVTIADGDTFVMDMEKLVFANGDTLQANCSANASIIATVSYVGI